MADDLPTYADVEAAARRLEGFATVTPLLRAPELDALTGGTILVKAEPLQRTGSFKFRGAFNRLVQLSPQERAGGVVAWSSGNHAQGVAAAGALLDIETTIVMPADAPAIKTAATRRYGAEIVFYDRGTQDREAIARDLAVQRGAVLVPSFDDKHVIAGQGTAGLEIVRQSAAMGLALDDVVVPVSGGGLIAGIGLAVKRHLPDAAIYSAEPAGYDDHRRSLIAGEVQRNPSTANALCDALLAPAPGRLTWPLNRAVLRAGYGVDDTDVKTAMAFSFHALKLVVEPGGAVALAALLKGHHACRGRTVAVVLSGGNVDAATFAESLATNAD